MIKKKKEVQNLTRKQNKITRNIDIESTRKHAYDEIRWNKPSPSTKRTEDLKEIDLDEKSKELQRLIKSLPRDDEITEREEIAPELKEELSRMERIGNWGKLSRRNFTKELQRSIESLPQVQTVEQNVPAEQQPQNKSNIEVIENYIKLYIELCVRKDNLVENIKNKNNKNNKFRLNEYQGMDVKELEELLSQVEQLLLLLDQKYTKFIQSLDEVQLKETTIIINKKKTDLEKKFEEVSQRYSLVKSKFDTVVDNYNHSEISEYIKIERDCKREFTSIKSQLLGYTKFANKLNYHASQRQAKQDIRPEQQIQDKSNETDINIHRVIVKLQVNDNRLRNPFEAGETILSDYDFQWLKTNYPNNVVEIPMSNQEWLEYLSSEVHKSYEKAVKLQMICEQFGLDVELPAAFDERTKSIFSAAMKGEILNPKEYNGLNDIIKNTWNYITDIEAYEKIVFAKFNTNSKNR